RDVVAAVSRAGGFGGLGASSFSPEQLDLELGWIDDHVGGKPYGVDVLIPEHQPVGREGTLEELAESIPARHRDFVRDLLSASGVTLDQDLVSGRGRPTTLPDVSEALMDVAFRRPIRLIANALGIAPPEMIERGKAGGVPVAALVGA